MHTSDRPEGATLSLNEDEQLLEELKSKVASGVTWYLALLEAIGKWKQTEETINGKCYRYLIGGEAFDWILLVSRLSKELDGIIPENEKEDLIFNHKEPVFVSPDDFRRLIGPSKYKAFLNYYYGIEVEEALISAVEQEVRKEKKALGFLDPDEEEVTDEAFKRLYRNGFSALLKGYACEKGLPDINTFLLYEWKEFIYWLFQLRIRLNDKERCASDTKKALHEIHKQRSAGLLKVC